jgi:hypothetical protein
MTETPTEIMREEIFKNIIQTDGLQQSLENIMSIIAHIEAERDAALATLAAARTMLDATGAALADATKRVVALEAERDAAFARIDALTLTATEAYRDGHFVGEQRATAAIVAWVRGMSDNGWSMGACPAVPTVQP